MTTTQTTQPHAFGLERGRCIFCGVHRDDPKAAESCTASTTGTIITL